MSRTIDTARVSGESNSSQSSQCSDQHHCNIFLLANTQPRNLVLQYMVMRRIILLSNNAWDTLDVTVDCQAVAIHSLSAKFHSQLMFRISCRSCSGMLLYLYRHAMTLAMIFSVWWSMRHLLFLIQNLAAHICSGRQVTPQSPWDQQTHSPRAVPAPAAPT